jgi:hypothetical protein
MIPRPPIQGKNPPPDHHLRWRGFHPLDHYNDFLDWVSFGGPVIKSGDPVEQDKQLKYASLRNVSMTLGQVQAKFKLRNWPWMRAD